MNQQTVLVVDDDPKNIEILVGALINSGFQAATALNGLDAWQKIKKYLPDLILTEIDLPEMDGFQLLTKIKADPQTAPIPLIFLTGRSGIQDKVKSFTLGAKDYIVKPLHVREIIARIKMILARLTRRKQQEEEVSSRLVGRLQELSVVDLIESFGVERKTGILNLTNENNKSGQIFFRDGSIVNAVLGNFRAEKAVYQMLPWERGTFAMVLQDVDVADEVSISNLGLLIEGFKRL
ncbi:MAG: response regulator, partial [bacterium]